MQNLILYAKLISSMKNLLFGLFPTLCFAAQQDELLALQTPPLSIFKKQMRSSALESVDKFLSWTFQYPMRSYTLAGATLPISLNAPSLQSFLEDYSFFSEYTPLVATVSSAASDIDKVEKLYQAAQIEILHPEHFQRIWLEITTKILAYRELQENMVLRIPTLIENKLQLVEYDVEKRFDLWQGMPAFGLAPRHPLAEPLLIFRGTDPSFGSKWGWASIVSDLDPKGPGLTVFQRCSEELKTWLAQKAALGVKARALGFSLGGVLTTYTVLYLSEFLSERPSVAFNPPGVSRQIQRLFAETLEEKPLPLITYVTQGDIISKVGYLVGPVFELSLKDPLPPIAAHVTPLSFGPHYLLAPVDVIKENSQRKF